MVSYEMIVEIMIDRKNCASSAICIHKNYDYVFFVTRKIENPNQLSATALLHPP